MEEQLGQVYVGATGYTPAIDEYCILLRSDFNTDAVTAVHEFVHNVSMVINQSIPNNPRWLWEAVALYEAEQFYNPANMNFIQQNNYPTLQQLNTGFNDGNQIIYEIGYVLAEYIVENWGKTMLAQLIRSNGNIQTDLGLTSAEFESGWHQYIKDTYIQ